MNIPEVLLGLRPLNPSGLTGVQKVEKEYNFLVKAYNLAPSACGKNAAMKYYSLLRKNNRIHYMKLVVTNAFMSICN